MANEEKELRTRFKLRTDARNAWKAQIPKKGEPIVYQDKGISRLKIGDEATIAEKLPFIGQVNDTYYQNIVHKVTSENPKETIIYTGIKYVSSSHMPVVRIYGYAYGLNSPIELQLGFYVYDGQLGWSGVVSMGAWRPEVRLFKYTKNKEDYVAIGLIGQCYYLGFQVDISTPALGDIHGSSIELKDWEIVFHNDTGHIPVPNDDKTCVTVPYKSTLEGLTINGSKYDGTSALSYNLLPTSGGTITGALTVNSALNAKSTVTVADTLIAYKYQKSHDSAAITLDKLGNGSFGIGGNGNSMTVQYGQASLTTGDWQTEQNIIHEFKGTLRNNGVEVSKVGHTHTKADVGLSNVDNTADSTKSVKYASTAGSAGAATTAQKLSNVDTRDDNQNPNWYFDQHEKTVVNEFKRNNIIGITSDSSYADVLTVVPWTDSSGGFPAQIALDGNKNLISVRKANNGTEWSDWKTLAFKEDVDTADSAILNFVNEKAPKITPEFKDSVKISSTQDYGTTSLVFQRGTDVDGANDWTIRDKGGFFELYHDKNESTPAFSANPGDNSITVKGLKASTLTTTGNINSSGNITGGWVTGTWLKASAATNLSSTPSKIAVLSGDNWIYWRTPSEIRSDIGAATAVHNHDDRYYTESEINTKLEKINPSYDKLYSNLGDPTLYELAFLDTEFVNRTDFLPPENVLIERSANGTFFAEDTSISDTVKKMLFGGDDSAYIQIPGGHYLRVTLTTSHYVYLNTLYLYGSPGANKFSIKIEKKKPSKDWEVVTDFTNPEGGWPGHLIVKHNNIAWLSGQSNDNYFDKVRFTIKVINGNSTDYPNSDLSKIQWWGGYPAASRSLWKTDYDKNVTFPASVEATAFLGNVQGNASTATIADSVSTVSAGANASRPVFFARQSDNTSVVYNTNFQYNPSTELLSVGKVQLKELDFPTSGGYTPKIGCNTHTIQVKTGSKQIQVSNTVGNSLNTYTFPDKDGAFALTSDIPTNYVTTDTTQTISGDKTFTGTIIAKKPIQANSYKTGVAAPAITLDKTGTGYAGIGAGAENMTVLFAPLSSIASTTWDRNADDITWKFRGSITSTKNVTASTMQTDTLSIVKSGALSSKAKRYAVLSEYNSLCTRTPEEVRSDIGAAKAVHSHDDRYYTKSEINTTIANYVKKAGDTMTGPLTIKEGAYSGSATFKFDSSQQCMRLVFA